MESTSAIGAAMKSDPHQGSADGPAAEPSPHEAAAALQHSEQSRKQMQRRGQKPSAPLLFGTVCTFLTLPVIAAVFDLSATLVYVGFAVLLPVVVLLAVAMMRSRGYRARRIDPTLSGVLGAYGIAGALLVFSWRSPDPTPSPLWGAAAGMAGYLLGAAVAWGITSLVNRTLR